MRNLRRVLSLALWLVLVSQQGGLAVTWYAQEPSVDISHAGLWDDIHDGGGNVLTWANLAAGDVLCANGKTALHIDASFTCGRISTAAEVGVPDAADGPGAAGGGFTVDAAVTITANITAGTSGCVGQTGNTYAAVVIGAITGGTGNPAIGYSKAGTSTLTVTGAVTGGSGYCCFGIQNGSTGAVVVNGTVTGGTTTTATNTGVYISLGSSAVTINSGNLIDTTTNNAVDGPFVYNPGATNYYRAIAPGSTTKDYYYDVPTAANTLTTDTTAGVTGTYQAVANTNVRLNTPVGVSPAVGTIVVPAATAVSTAATVDNGSGTAISGTCYVPSQANTLYNVDVGQAKGTLTLPNANTGAPYTANPDLVLTTGWYGVIGALVQGHYWEAPKNRVKIGYYFGANRVIRGSY
jgi:hypothetical protein